jgi:hypothetical protein
MGLSVFFYQYFAPLALQGKNLSVSVTHILQILKTSSPLINFSPSPLPGQCRRPSGVARHKPESKKQVRHRNNILILKKLIDFLHNPSMMGREPGLMPLLPKKHCPARNCLLLSRPHSVRYGTPYGRCYCYCYCSLLLTSSASGLSWRTALPACHISLSRIWRSSSSNFSR